MHVPSSLGDTASDVGTTPDTSTSWITDISNVLTQGLSVYGQVRLQDMNMKLIQQGKPPLTAAQISAMAPQLNVGISPDLQDSLIKGLLIGGIGVVAILMLTKGKRT
jgi:hypothetical protein